VSSTYKDLEVWKSSMQLAVQVYQLTKGYPSEERYGLTSQLRRAAVSVASNIAEGKGRSSDRELIQFLCHSRGSLFEVETQLSLGKLLGYGCDEEYAALATQTAKIGRMLNGLMRSINPSGKEASRRRVEPMRP
jgi:four helix bundle protein